MYGGMAIMGFTMFGDETESQITLNLPGKFLISKVAVWTTVLSLDGEHTIVVNPNDCLEISNVVFWSRS